MEYVEILSAGLTPVIAIVTTIVMVQQYRLDKRNSRYQLFKHRHAIFEAIMFFISSIVRDAEVDMNLLSKFMIETRDSSVFFDDDISDYINILYKKAIRLQLCGKKLNQLPVGDERNKFADEDYEIVTFFSEQSSICKKKFSKYLSFKKP